MGKVSAKSFMRTFPGGSMFSFDVTDKTGTIRMTVFSKVPAFQEVYSLVKVLLIMHINYYVAYKFQSK